MSQISVFGVFSKVLRASGQALDKLGRAFETNPNLDRLVPSTRVVKLGNATPKVKSAYIMPTATVVGNVSIGPKTSVMYGAVVRGDVNSISIGESVTIGDRAMIHCSGHSSNFPTKIGNNVILGSGSIVHGSTVGNNCYIGEGAQLLDGVKLGDNSIVAAGAFVKAGETIPSGQLWAGIPAKYERDLLKEEIEKISNLVTENVEVAEEHALECAKSWQTIEDDLFNWHQKHDRNDYYHRQLSPEEWAERRGDVEGYPVPGRILNSPLTSTIMPEQRPDDEGPEIYPGEKR